MTKKDLQFIAGKAAESVNWRSFVAKSATTVQVLSAENACLEGKPAMVQAFSTGNACLEGMPAIVQEFLALMA
ncbi:hypothetical protein [Paenibacillus beijingensis]|uniref:Uncharacterized protein n=1 Tax=Paenibacillus beijingensis TaxID=1126833 RepID=A0A0D5NEN6_9BACL|nr:hypothetical protein [Paenibacillus beijingensis]AJY73442.1 hypothetical protein VN24_00875 [Paenibacillus beijingensis]